MTVPPDVAADHEDTAPQRIVNPGLLPAPEHVWATAPVAFPAPPVRIGRQHNTALLLGVAVLAAVLGAGAAMFWLRDPAPSSEMSTVSPPAPSTPTSIDPEQQAKLLQLVPGGYPAGACGPVEAPKDALAKVDCANNADPGGPTSASFTLFKDQSALSAAFNDVVHTSSVVVCPGNFQSPGPWRRNANPQVSAGTLVCGQQQKLPTVAWSTDGEKLLSVARSKPGGPNLEQLYAWWSTHS